MPRKRLPIGIQTFREIREDGCYYVDKTGFALRLIEQGNAFFLSRPRCFGKSLFIDTLAELFAGNEPLFRGLEAHDSWDWERRFPVVRLSFAEGVLHSRSELDEKAAELLAENERRLGVGGDAPSLSGRFSQLLRLAEERHGERVVVLVDDVVPKTPVSSLVVRDGNANLPHRVLARAAGMVAESGTDADKYRAEGLPIHLIGVEFSRERRTLVGFEVESTESQI